MVNQYTLPAKAQFAGPPDRSKLAGFKYTCLTCSTTCGQCSDLQAHIAGKSHAKKTTTEDPNIISKLAQYAKLEAPHREAKKENADGDKPSFMQKILEFKKSMTKEELKEHEKEKKRKRQEEGLPSNKKKKKVCVPFKCGCCDKELPPSDVAGHMQGAAHYKKVKQFDGGCWLCNVAAPADAAHFEGKKHTSHMARLAEVGVPEAAIYAMTQAAAMEVATAMMGGNGAQLALANGGGSKKAKKKGAANGGGQMTIAQMAALAGIGSGKSSKAKKKANKVGKEPNGDATDKTCWDFRKGECNRETCKFVHE